MCFSPTTSPENVRTQPPRQFLQKLLIGCVPKTFFITHTLKHIKVVRILYMQMPYTLLRDHVVAGRFDLLDLMFEELLFNHQCFHFLALAANTARLRTAGSGEFLAEAIFFAGIF